MSQPTPNSLFDTQPPRNKGGRPKGSRSKLATRFFEDVYAAWEEQGSSVIARAFFHDPVASMNMVARLMPQKIEVSTPTDGISDERLGELLDYAERMAGLKATQAIEVQARVLTDEKGRSGVVIEEGGGGPLSEMGGGGEKTSSTQRADPAEKTEQGHNELVPNKLIAPSTPPKGFSATMPHGEAAPTRRPPVGKPFAKAPHDIERANRSALAVPAAVPAQDPVDPESLF